MNVWQQRASEEQFRWPWASLMSTAPAAVRRLLPPLLPLPIARQQMSPRSSKTDGATRVTPTEHLHP
jgi:hypothetical protein